MAAALYGSIWIALACFVIGETGKRLQRRSATSARWAIYSWILGAALAWTHALLALHFVYGWDHERAIAVAAERAGRVYGVPWRGSLYMNYAFLIWWAVEVVWWRLRPAAYLTRWAAIEWAWRLAAFTMLLNGAVIFASPMGRVAGLPLMAALAYAWRPAFATASARQARYR